MGFPERGATTLSLADIVDRILDKGLVINADITVAVVGVELLGIKVRAAVASFETAAAYGLEFPSGTRLPALAGQSVAPLGQNGARPQVMPELRLTDTRNRAGRSERGPNRNGVLAPPLTRRRGESA